MIPEGPLAGVEGPFPASKYSRYALAIKDAIIVYNVQALRAGYSKSANIKCGEVL